MQDVTTTTADNRALTALYVGVQDGKEWYSVSFPNSIKDNDMFALMQIIARSRGAIHTTEHGGADEHPTIEFVDSSSKEFVIKERFVCVSACVYQYLISVSKI